MTKITSLTEQQKRDHDEYFAEAMRIGTSTEPMDRELAMHAITSMYRYVKKANPVFVFTDSPATGALACAVIAGLKDNKNRQSLRQSLGQSLRQSLWQSLDQSLRQSLWQSLDQSLRQSLWQSLGQSLRESLWQSLDQSLDQSLGQSLRQSLWQSLGQSLWQSLGAAHLQYWICFYRFCRHIGADYFPWADDAISWWHDLSRSACWWFPYENICVVCDRPRICRINERRVLHCDDGPAMKFADGWTLWQLDGVAVDEQIVTKPETQTIDQIKSERNEEVRRIRIERFGWERYLRETNSKVAHTRFNERDLQHEHLYVLDDGTRRFVVSDPSTGRKYALGCPREIQTCEEAQGFLSHGLDRFACHRS